jgi:RNA polymerase sigma factor (sigma-70 family)
MNSSSDIREDSPDWELLEAYARHGSDTAFAVLVRRHLNMVYSVAFRFCADHCIAEEVSNNVFLALARKAREIKREVKLAGWLFLSAKQMASNARGFESRRQQWRRDAATEETLLGDSADGSEAEVRRAWEIVSAQLDLAVGELGDADRDAILLRFYEQKSLREIAVEFDTTEEAARKRVSRALDKLRDSLARRGVACPSALLAMTLAAFGASAAPAGVGQSITVAVASLSSVTAKSSATQGAPWKTTLYLRSGFPRFALMSVLCVGVVFSGAKTIRFFENRAERGRIRAVFLRLSDAVARGDGEAYVKTLYLDPSAETAIRPILVKGIEIDFQLRTVLLDRFGTNAVLNSPFARMLDMVDTSRLAGAAEVIDGDEGILMTPWGSRLPFIKRSGEWKFNYFAMPGMAPPSAYRLSAANRQRVLAGIIAEVESGRHASVESVYRATRRDGVF